MCEHRFYITLSLKFVIVGLEPDPEAVCEHPLLTSLVYLLVFSHVLALVPV